MLAVPSACDQPVTGRASLIFDRLGGTRASWRAVVVDGSAAEVLNLGEAAGARRSSCPDLMRLQGGAKQLLAAVACPTAPTSVVLRGAKATGECGCGP